MEPPLTAWGAPEERGRLRVGRRAGSLLGSLSQRGRNQPDRTADWGGGGMPRRRSHRSPRVPEFHPRIRRRAQASRQAGEESQDSVGGALLLPRKMPGLISYFCYPGLHCPVVKMAEERDLRGPLSPMFCKWHVCGCTGNRRCARTPARVLSAWVQPGTLVRRRAPTPPSGLAPPRVACDLGRCQSVPHRAHTGRPEGLAAHVIGTHSLT